MITSILIDYDGVFIPDEYRGIRSICPEKRIEQLENPYYIVSDCTQFWQDLRTEFNLNWTNTELRSRYNYEDFEQLSHEQQLMNMLSTYQSQFKFFLISNQISDRTSYLRETKNFTLFSGVYFSSEIGLKKPDRDIFTYIIEKEKLKIESCLFIDDSIENIKSAKLLGMHNYLFTDTEKLAKKLKKI
jgi:glucose-1-phosphatase